MKNKTAHDTQQGVLRELKWEMWVTEMKVDKATELMLILSFLNAP